MYFYINRAYFDYLILFSFSLCKLLSFVICISGFDPYLRDKHLYNQRQTIHFHYSESIQ